MEVYTEGYVVIKYVISELCSSGGMTTAGFPDRENMCMWKDTEA